MVVISALTGNKDSLDKDKDRANGGEKIRFAKKVRKLKLGEAGDRVCPTTVSHCGQPNNTSSFSPAVTVIIWQLLCKLSSEIQQ